MPCAVKFPVQKRADERRRLKTDPAERSGAAGTLQSGGAARHVLRKLGVTIDKRLKQLFFGGFLVNFKSVYLQIFEVC